MNVKKQDLDTEKNKWLNKIKECEVETADVSEQDKNKRAEIADFKRD